MKQFTYQPPSNQVDNYQSRAPPKMRSHQPKYKSRMPGSMPRRQSDQLLEIPQGISYQLISRQKKSAMEKVQERRSIAISRNMDSTGFNSTAGLNQDIPELPVERNMTTHFGKYKGSFKSIVLQIPQEKQIQSPTQTVNSQISNTNHSIKSPGFGTNDGKSGSLTSFARTLARGGRMSISASNKTKKKRGKKLYPFKKKGQVNPEHDMRVQKNPMQIERREIAVIPPVKESNYTNEALRKQMGLSQVDTPKSLLNRGDNFTTITEQLQDLKSNLGLKPQYEGESPIKPSDTPLQEPSPLKMPPIPSVKFIETRPRGSQQVGDIKNAFVQGKRDSTKSLQMSKDIATGISMSTPKYRTLAERASGKFIPISEQLNDQKQEELYQLIKGGGDSSQTLNANRSQLVDNIKNSLKGSPSNRVRLGAIKSLEIKMTTKQVNDATFLKSAPSQFDLGTLQSRKRLSQTIKKKEPQFISTESMLTVSKMAQNIQSSLAAKRMSLPSDTQVVSAQGEVGGGQVNEAGEDEMIEGPEEREVRQGYIDQINSMRQDLKLDTSNQKPTLGNTELKLSNTASQKHSSQHLFPNSRVFGCPSSAKQSQTKLTDTPAKGGVNRQSQFAPEGPPTESVQKHDIPSSPQDFTFDFEDVFDSRDHNEDEVLKLPFNDFIKKFGIFPKIYEPEKIFSLEKSSKVDFIELKNLREVIKLRELKLSCQKKSYGLLIQYKLASAYKYIKKGLKAFPDDFQLNFNKAFYFYLNQEYATCMNIWAKLLIKNPRKISLLINLMLSYMKLDLYEGVTIDLRDYVAHVTDGSDDIELINVKRMYWYAYQKANQVTAKNLNNLDLDGEQKIRKVSPQPSDMIREETVEDESMDEVPKDLLDSSRLQTESISNITREEDDQIEVKIGGQSARIEKPNLDKVKSRPRDKRAKFQSMHTTKNKFNLINVEDISNESTNLYNASLPPLRPNRMQSMKAISDLNSTKRGNSVKEPESAKTKFVSKRSMKILFKGQAAQKEKFYQILSKRAIKDQSILDTIAQSQKDTVDINEMKNKQESKILKVQNQKLENCVMMLQKEEEDFKRQNFNIKDPVDEEYDMLVAEVEDFRRLYPEEAKKIMKTRMIQPKKSKQELWERPWRKKVQQEKSIFDLGNGAHHRAISILADGSNPDPSSKSHRQTVRTEKTPAKSTLVGDGQSSEEVKLNTDPEIAQIMQIYDADYHSAKKLVDTEVIEQMSPDEKECHMLGITKAELDRRNDIQKDILTDLFRVKKKVQKQPLVRDQVDSVKMPNQPEEDVDSQFEDQTNEFLTYLFDTYGVSQCTAKGFPQSNLFKDSIQVEQLRDYMAKISRSVNIKTQHLIKKDPIDLQMLYEKQNEHKKSMGVSSDEEYELLEVKHNKEILDKVMAQTTQIFATKEEEVKEKSQLYNVLLQQINTSYILQGMIKNHLKILQNTQMDVDEQTEAESMFGIQTKKQNKVKFKKQPSTVTTRQLKYVEVIILRDFYIKAKLAGRLRDQCRSDSPSRMFDYEKVDPILSRLKFFKTFEYEVRMKLYKIAEYDVLPCKQEIISYDHEDLERGQFGFQQDPYEKLEHAEKRESIFEKFYVILNGTCSVVEVDKKKNIETVVATLMDGETFGDSFNRIESVNTQMKVVASTNCDILQLNRKAFANIMFKQIREELYEKILTLRNSELFSDLSPYILVVLSSCVYFKTFTYGNILVSQNDIPEECYIIVQGKCKVIYQDVITKRKYTNTVIKQNQDTPFKFGIATYDQFNIQNQPQTQSQKPQIQHTMTPQDRVEKTFAFDNSIVDQHAAPPKEMGNEAMDMHEYYSFKHHIFIRNITEGQCVCSRALLGHENVTTHITEDISHFRDLVTRRKIKAAHSKPQSPETAQTPIGKPPLPEQQPKSRQANLEPTPSGESVETVASGADGEESKISIKNVFGKSSPMTGFSTMMKAKKKFREAEVNHLKTELMKSQCSVVADSSSVKVLVISLKHKDMLSDSLKTIINQKIREKKFKDYDRPFTNLDELNGLRNTEKKWETQKTMIIQKMLNEYAYRKSVQKSL